MDSLVPLLTDQLKIVSFDYKREYLERGQQVVIEEAAIGNWRQYLM